MTRNARIAALFAALLTAGLLLVGCQSTNSQSSSQEGQKLTEQAFKQQSAAVPYPVSELKDSAERRNLRERLLRMNQADRIGYVYLLNFGKPFGYYTINGKVSSTDSQMTPSEEVRYACDDGLSGCQALAVQAPGDDGSYGPNENGIFFFTTENALVQTTLDYIYSDQPIAVFNVPELNGDTKVKGAE